MWLWQQYPPSTCPVSARHCTSSSVGSLGFMTLPRSSALEPTGKCCKEQLCYNMSIVLCNIQTHYQRRKETEEEDQEDPTCYVIG